MTRVQKIIICLGVSICLLSGCRYRFISTDKLMQEKDAKINDLLNMEVIDEVSQENMEGI